MTDDARDEILRCTAGAGATRVVVVTATDVAREAIRRHGATGAAVVALARGLTSGLLLATLTKDDERATLQLLGDGPLGGITVDATAAGTARGYVRNPDDARAPIDLAAPRPSVARAVGTRGVVSVVRDVGLREPFSGQTEIVSGEVDEDCEHYLTTSEQIESALRCETVLAPDGSLVAAAGVLVQALPGGRGVRGVLAARAHFEDGALQRALASAPPDAQTLVERMLDDGGSGFGEALGPVVTLDARPVRFHCPCTRERAAASIALLGAAEIASMILEDGQAEVACNFCRSRHTFTAADLELMRRELEGPAGPPS
ncbi:MAG TPA: Hsp33 family molecular chaperone HslO [Polyangia bacterium]|nr:Hsp33 family molecular chaperone HslO [Polyangia bacterium]